MSIDLPTGTKREILDLLVRRERSAEELAQRLDITSAAVRQHLTTLAEGGFVERTRGGSGSGRPAYIYRLSSRASEAYPKRYDVLAVELIEALIERHGREEALGLVEDAARRLVARVGGGFTRRDRERRLDRVLSWLEEEFAWEADREPLPGGRRRIVIHRCPFQEVSADHPALCGRFFTTLLGGLIEEEGILHEAIGDGLRCCALDLPEREDTATPGTRS